MAKKPTPASSRFSEFRSWAREISEEANRQKKYRRSMDVNGQMARAMERAYKQGFEDALTGSEGIKVENSQDPNDPTPVPESLVTAKISGPLHYIGMKQVGLSGRLHTGNELRAFYLQENYISDYRRKAPDWQLIDRYHVPNNEKGVSDRTIQQLVKLGILEPVTTVTRGLHDRNILVLSQKGIATYKSMFLMQ